MEYKSEITRNIGLKFLIQEKKLKELKKNNEKLTSLHYDYSIFEFWTYFMFLKNKNALLKKKKILQLKIIKINQRIKNKIKIEIQVAIKFIKMRKFYLKYLLLSMILSSSIVKPFIRRYLNHFFRNFICVNWLMFVKNSWTISWIYWIFTNSWLLYCLTLFSIKWN